MNKCRVGLLCTVVASLSACTHSMQVKNIDSYVKTASAPTQLTIALRSGSDAPGPRVPLRPIERPRSRPTNGSTTIPPASWIVSSSLMERSSR